MHEPRLSDYGLDDATVRALRAKVARLDSLKIRGGCALFVIAYAIVVAASWPFLGVASMFLVIPAAMLGALLLWLATLLSKTHFEKRLSGIPGYDALCRFESASQDYERHREQAEIEALRERARRELERKRRSWEYWTSLSAGQFEYEVAELFKTHGYDAKITPGSGDGGIDIILTKDGSTTFVQCKRYKNKVGPAPIRELYGVMVARGVKGGIVVCPAGFTEGAWNFARRASIRLVGLKRLIELSDTEPVDIDG